jgi:DNA-directed RNA polymerase specialized sigma24 family protein
MREWLSQSHAIPSSSGCNAEDAAVRHQSLEAVARAYWESVRKYLCLRWHESAEDAADITQAFFSKSIESATFVHYEPAKGTFRTYLRTCLDHFLLNARKKERTRTVPLVLDVAAAAGSPEEIFHREWARNLFSLAIADLHAGRDEVRFRVFERYDLNDSDPRPSYQELLLNSA